MTKHLTLCRRVRNLIAAALTILFLPALPAYSAGTGNHPRVQEAIALLELWLEAIRDYERIPGLSAAIVHDQEVLWSGGFGFADPDKEIPADGDTIYGICSVTKLFTSIAVMQLRDRGHLSLDDDVRELLPEFSVEQAFPESGPITVKGLLTHTSGVPAEVNAPYSTPPDFGFPAKAEFLRLQAEQKTYFPASTNYEYSNLGMSILGEIIATKSGQPFERYMRHELLDPLQLNDTYTGIPLEEAGRRLALGHGALRRDGSRPAVGLYDARAYTPAAGFASTVNDLAAFASWQFRVVNENDNETIDASSLRQMYQPYFMLPGWEMAQGLGFEVDRINGTVYVGHSGICPGFVSRIQIEPEQQLAAVVLVNANNVDEWNIVTRMLEMFAPAVEVAANTTEVDHGTSDEAGSESVDLTEYLGLFDAWPWNADTAFISWQGELAALRLSSRNPVRDLRHWKHVDGDVFRRVRDDGLPVEKWTFERDASGEVVRVRVYGDHMNKIR